MPKRYKKLNVPLDTYNLLKERQMKINGDLQGWGIKRRIPLTRIIGRYAAMPLTFDNKEDVISFTRRKHKK